MKKLIRVEEVVHERPVYTHYCDICGVENNNREVWNGENDDQYEICVKMERMTYGITEEKDAYCICPECYNKILKPFLEEHRKKVEDKLYVKDFPTTLPSEGL